MAREKRNNVNFFSLFLFVMYGMTIALLGWVESEHQEIIKQLIIENLNQQTTIELLIKSNNDTVELIGNLTNVVIVSPKNYVERDCIVTAYCACNICCGKNAKGITASSYRIRPGDKLVASSDGYPFGTRVFIAGYDDKPVEILDRGSKFGDDHLDVYFDTHEEATQWGKKLIRVRIYKNND